MKELNVEEMGSIAGGARTDDKYRQYQDIMKRIKGEKNSTALQNYRLELDSLRKTAFSGMSEEEIEKAYQKWSHTPIKG